MGTEEQKTIGELATELDDLALTVEELQADPPPHVDQDHLDTIKNALDDASDAADELIEQQSE